MSVQESRSFIRLVLRRVLRLLRYSLLFLFILVFLGNSTLPAYTLWYRVANIVSDYQFDYLGWELGALGAKTSQALWGVHPFMTEADRSDFVRRYFADLQRARQLDARIDVLYADPTILAPEETARDLRAERDQLRTSLSERQSAAEAILEGQVATILVKEGFGTAGQLLPPIAMRFTRVPNLVVVSPRDKIEMQVSINVDALPVERQIALEQAIEEQLDVSALIVPLGGIALYPAMILETDNLPYAIETFAHEWLHHYLFLFPLGLTYDFTGEARIINETSADVFGKVIWPKVVTRYYPEYIPMIPAEPFPAPPTPFERVLRYLSDWLNSLNLHPVGFDFGAEMNETRVTVDELLASGRVEEAEAYMEERRHLFAENGYLIRRLNQAYFAFYGGYQGGAVPGIGGEDPIGPAVREIYTRSDSILDFVLALRGITTREELVEAADKSAAGE
jgi:hypothetical protein